MRLHGVDAELLDRNAVKAMYPWLNYENARFPIQGGLLQRRGGTVRHDAVAWGYARGADRLGVDIIENAEVTGISHREWQDQRGSRRHAALSVPIKSVWRAPETLRVSRRWPA